MDNSAHQVLPPATREVTSDNLSGRELCHRRRNRQKSPGYRPPSAGPVAPYIPPCDLATNITLGDGYAVRSHALGMRIRTPTVRGNLHVDHVAP